MEETNLDDVHRSNSAVDYAARRVSRRDLDELGGEPAHLRSKSADYLIERRRETALNEETEEGARRRAAGERAR